MSTLTGKLKFNDGYIAGLVLQFWPLTYPKIESAEVISGGISEATTDEDGNFSVELANAVYRVEWWYRGIRNRGMFALTDTADLGSILVSEIAETVPYYFDTVAEFEASTTGATMVGIGADGNGDPAIFRKNSAGTVNDGVNGIVRNDGVAYVRFSGNPIA